MQLTSLPRALVLSSIAWLIFGGLASVFLYIVTDNMGLDSLASSVGIYLTLTVSVVLFLFGLFIHVSKKYLNFHYERLLRGVGLLFLVYFFGVLGLAFMLVVPVHHAPYLWGLIIIAATAWCWIVLSAYQQRIKNSRFIEREFLLKEDRIVVRQPLKTILGSETVSQKWFFGRLYNRFGPYLVIGIPLAYPIQSLLSNIGGTPAVLFLLAILGLPLTFYILGRLVCGGYLWVFKVWQLERRHGKLVVLQTTD